jgi:uncharacterized repeat protein (TIGR02543 family)
VVTDQIAAGTDFTAGQVLTSPNGRFTLVWQTDGDMVQKDGSEVILRLSTKGATRALLQKDGNFVIYDGTTALWSSGTAGRPAARLQVLDDGEVAIYGPDNQPYWSLGAPSTATVAASEKEAGFPPRAGKQLGMVGCTQGFTVKDKSSGEYYLLTAGHCFGNGTVGGTGSWPGGSGRVEFNGGSYQIAGMKFPNGRYLQPSVWADGVVRAVTGLAELQEGDRVCARGRTSKKETCGTAHLSERIAPSGQPITVGEILGESGARLFDTFMGGDSGGPVYVVNPDGSASAAGVLEDTAGGFSPLAHGLTANNLEVVTSSSVAALADLGAVEAVRGGHGAVTVTGWARDPSDLSGSGAVDVCLGAPLSAGGANCQTAVPANRPSPQVQVPGAGASHGFTLTFTTDERGSLPIYVYTRTAAGAVAYIGGTSAPVASVKNVGGVTVAPSPVSVTLPLNGTSEPAVVNLNTNSENWTATSNQTWATVAKNGNVLQITASANTAGPRGAVVTVTAGYEKRTVTISQPGQPLHLSRYTVAAGTAESKPSVTVNSAGDWTARTAASWMNLSLAAGVILGGPPIAQEITGTAGAVPLYLWIDNNYGPARSATVEVISGGISKTIEVSQAEEAGSYLDVSQSEVAVPAEGSPQVITIKTDGPRVGISDNATWLYVRDDEADKTKYYVSADVNEGQSRSAEITITAGGMTRTVKAVQQAGPANNVILEVSPNPGVIPTDTGQITFAIKTNVPGWRLSFTGFSHGSGAGSGGAYPNYLYTMDFGANTGSSTRSGTAIFRAGTKEVTVPLTQAPPDVPTTYAVTFDSNGGAAVLSKTVKVGAQVGLLPAPTRSGYTLKGWFTAAAGGTQVGASTVVPGDITYYAQWDRLPNVCLVTVDPQGGYLLGNLVWAVNAGTQASLPVPVRPGYTLKGWFTAATGGTQVEASTVVNEDVTYYAQWDPAAPATYTVAFDSNGGASTGSRTVNAGAQVGSLPAPTRSGYTLKGWFTAATGGTQVQASTVVNGDVTYYAQWDQAAPATYTVTFNPQSGILVGSSTRTVNAGAQVGSFPQITRPGYVLKGWFTAATGGTQVQASTVVSANVTYYAQWDPVAPATYTVAFDANGGAAVASRTVNAGGQVGSLPAPTRSGYTLKGWFTAATGGTQVQASTVVSANVTYYAQWDAEAAPATYRVTFNSSGGVSTGSRVVEAGARVGSLPAPTRSGYTLKGWFTAATGGTQVQASTVVNGDVTYYAQWNKLGAASYTVTFNPQGGILVGSSTRTVNAGAQVGPFPQITRPGYVLKGWYTAASGGERVMIAAVVGANVTYYAQWTLATN